jgi:hypothetical protein
MRRLAGERGGSFTFSYLAHRVRQQAGSYRFRAWSMLRYEISTAINVAVRGFTVVNFPVRDFNRNQFCDATPDAFPAKAGPT